MAISLRFGGEAPGWGRVLIHSVIFVAVCTFRIGFMISSIGVGGLVAGSCGPVVNYHQILFCCSAM